MNASIRCSKHNLLKCLLCADSALSVAPLNIEVESPKVVIPASGLTIKVPCKTETLEIASAVEAAAQSETPVTSTPPQRIQRRRRHASVAPQEPSRIVSSVVVESNLNQSAMVGLKPSLETKEATPTTFMYTSEDMTPAALPGIFTKEIIACDDPPEWLIKPGQGARIEVVDKQITLVFLEGCENCGASLRACDCGDAKKPTEWLMWNRGVGLNGLIMKRLMDAKTARIARKKATTPADTIVDAAIATKSFLYDPSYKSVPSALKDTNIWLLFEVSFNRETGKFEKIPYHPVTAKKTNNPAQGASFNVARDAQVKWNDPVQRFALGIYIESPFVVTDIDECRDPRTGVIADWAREIIAELDSYAEASPSGTGVHIITTGEKPGERCKKGIEIYSTGRPLTVTGLHISGTPTTVNARDVAPLYGRMVRGEFLKYYKVKTGVNDASASSVPHDKRSSVKIEHHGGPITTELVLLMTGEFTENATPFVVSDAGGQNTLTFPSQSEAIGSLCYHLAFKHMGDADAVEKDFLESTLYKGITKWNKEDGKWERLGKDEIASACAAYEKSRAANLTLEDHQKIAMSAVTSMSPNNPAASIGILEEPGFDIDPEGGQKIPSFDARTIKGIYKKIVDLATNGTTMPPQIAYAISKTMIGTLLAGKVSFGTLSDVQPTQYLTVIGRTGTGKGWAWRRLSESIFNANATKPLTKRLKIVNSIDSAAGLRDLFFEEPETAPVLVFVDEITSLGNKASAKKNPEILDIMVELANSCSVSQVKARRSLKRSGTRTNDTARLSTVFCVPSDDALNRALVGRTDQGFKDRLTPEFAVPPLAGEQPEVDPTAAALLHEDIKTLVDSFVGVKIEMSDDASGILKECWNSQPEPVRRKVRFKQDLELDSYLNAIGRGSKIVEAEDARDAVINFDRRMVIRTAFFSQEHRDDVGRYLAALKRISASMLPKIAAGKDLWAVAMSKRDFQSATNAYRNDEEHIFDRAWSAYAPTNLQTITQDVQGVQRTKYYPVPNF